MPGLAWRKESRWDSSAASSRLILSRCGGLARSPGLSFSAIARKLGIGESDLGYWLKKEQADRKTHDLGRFVTESAASAENRALGRRVAEPEVER
jgi:transposase-like protein